MLGLPPPPLRLPPRPPARALAASAPRRLLAAGIALAALPVLAGCERPTPGVSVYSGLTTLRSEAFCWTEEGAVSPEDCNPDRVGRKELAVDPGSTIAINVDEPVVDVGWVPTVNGVPLTQEPIRGTHYRFSLPEAVLREDPELQVRATDRIGGPERGIWAFQLRLDD